MDLFERVLLVTVAVVMVIWAVVTVYSVITGATAATTFTKQQAEQAVISDIRTAAPDAVVSVVSVTNSLVAKDSWDIQLTVTYNATSPCPTFEVESYDYPATGFVPTTVNKYTDHCIIYGLSDAPYYVISSPQIAIAKSYNAMLPAVLGYVGFYGYDRVNVSAKFYGSFSANALGNRTMDDIWLVNYSAPGSSFHQYVVESQSGNILGNYSLRTG